MIANLAETLMPGYDRYFIKLKSKCAYDGWYSFDGVKLEQARKATAEDYKSFVTAIDDEAGIFFHPKIKFPHLFYKIDNFIEIFLAHLKNTKSSLKNEYKEKNILIVNYESHRNSILSVVNADIVILGVENIIEYVEKHYKKIVHYVSRQVAKIYPLGFARIAVYSRMLRKRTYKHYGLDKCLICVIQYKKLSEISCPTIFESTVENYGLYHIEWNKKWLAQQIVIESGE